MGAECSISGSTQETSLHIRGTGRCQKSTFICRQYGTDQNNDCAGPLLFCHRQSTFSFPIILINSVIFPKSGLYRPLMRNLIKRHASQAIWAAAGMMDCTSASSPIANYLLFFLIHTTVHNHKEFFWSKHTSIYVFPFIFLPSLGKIPFFLIFLFSPLLTGLLLCTDSHLIDFNQPSINVTTLWE